MKHTHRIVGIPVESNTRKLSDKTIADCVEAIIGVCIEYDQEGVNREVIGMHAMNFLLTTEFKTDWKKDYLPKVFEEYDLQGTNLRKERKIKIMDELNAMVKNLFNHFLNIQQINHYFLIY